MSKQTYTLQEIVEIATQVGIKVAHEEINKFKFERLRDRHNRRFRNTKMLLQNYRTFSIHKDEAVYRCDYEVQEILSELDDFDNDNDLFIESIKKSKERTKIIIKHIDKMFSVFRFLAESSKDETDQKRYKTVKMLYIEEEQSTIRDIAETLYVDERTVHRYKNDAIATLSSLIFGIDGMKWKN